MDRSSLQHYFLLGLIAGAFMLTFFVFPPFLAPLVLGAVFAVVLMSLSIEHKRRRNGTGD